VPALLAVLLLGVVLRLPYVAQRSLWSDEASSWWTASRPWEDLWASIRHNVHAPLYYLLLRGWMGIFGDSPPALRSLSILLGTLTIAGMFLFGRQLERRLDLGGGTKGLGLLVALLVATSPGQVQAAIEVKMYSLGTALLALGSWLLLLLIEEPRRARWWWGYVVCTVAFLYTHPYAVFSVATQYLFLVVLAARRAAQGQLSQALSLGRLIATTALTCIALYAPWLPVFHGQTARVQASYWIGPMNWWSLPGTLGELLVPEWPWSPADLGLITLYTFLVTVVAVWRPQPAQVLLLASFVLPMGMAAVASLWTPVWAPRCLRFAHLFFLAAVAVAIGRLAVGWIRPALSALVIAAFLLGCAGFWYTLDLADRPGMRGAMEQIASAPDKEGPILVFPYYHFFAARYYAPPGVSVMLVEPDEALIRRHGGPALAAADILSWPAALSQLRAGAWLLSDQGEVLLQGRATEGVRVTLENCSNYYYRFHRPVCFGHYVLSEPAR
jgi:uncharacterized membrane protein